MRWASHLLVSNYKNRERPFSIAEHKESYKRQTTWHNDCGLLLKSNVTLELPRCSETIVCSTEE